MLYIIAWFVLAIVIGFVAVERGRDGVGWFFLSLLLSPIVGAIALALCPPRLPTASTGERKQDSREQN